MRAKSISLKLFWALTLLPAARAEQKPALFCIGNDQILARSSKGEWQQSSYQQASDLLANPEWEAWKRGLEEWRAAEPALQKVSDAEALGRLCRDDNPTGRPDVSVIVTQSQSQGKPEIILAFVYATGVYSSVFTTEKNQWKKPDTDKAPLTAIFGTNRPEDAQPDLQEAQSNDWPKFWDGFINKRLASSTPVSNFVTRSGKWVQFATIRNASDVSWPLVRMITIPRVIEKTKGVERFPPAAFVACLLAACAGFFLWPVIELVRKREGVRVKVGSQAALVPASNLNARGRTKVKAPIATASVRTGIEAHGRDSNDLVAESPLDILESLTTRLSERIEGQVEAFENNARLVENNVRLVEKASALLDSTVKKISELANRNFHEIGSEMKALLQTIGSAANELKNVPSEVKKETASLAARFTRLDDATGRMAQAADQLVAGHAAVTKLLSQLKSDAAEVAVAKREADAARDAEKNAREAVNRLEAETNRLKKQLQSDTSAAAMPILSKLEEDLKKALRNFSGSTQDRTGLTSPLLALLISHCLYLLALAMKSNDALLQAAMRANLSKITEIGSGLNLLGFVQARETLRSAGWLTSGLPPQDLSEDSDLKDASWFQTALKCIRDRETLEFGPFYVGIDSKGKVQYVN